MIVRNPCVLLFAYIRTRVYDRRNCTATLLALGNHGSWRWSGRRVHLKLCPFGPQWSTSPSGPARIRNLSCSSKGPLLGQRTDAIVICISNRNPQCLRFSTAVIDFGRPFSTRWERRVDCLERIYLALSSWVLNFRRCAHGCAGLMHALR